MSSRAFGLAGLAGKVGFSAAVWGLLGLMAPAAVWAQDHAAHAHALGAGVKRSEVSLQPAAVNVLREDGQQVALQRVLDDDRPVVLNFIFTSCTAICPVMSQVFREVRDRLGPASERMLMVSVSIDPEYDTPARMKDYARRFAGGTTSWRFLTATVKDSVAIQQSFNAYQGDKMNHLPLTFVRPAKGANWIRYDGFASPELLVQTVKPLLEASKAGKPKAP